MPTCPNGHDVDADTAFCRQCGAYLVPPDEPTVVLPLAAMPPAAQAARRPAQSNTAVYALAAVIVVIGLVGIGLALVLGSGGTSGRPTPVTDATPSASAGGSTASPSPRPTAATKALPAGGTPCAGTVGGGGKFGTIGSETSCGFVQAVYQSYVGTAGSNPAQGQTTTVSATSPATHKTYDNIVCTAGDPWVTCVGGNDNTARMFFAHP